MTFETAKAYIRYLDSNGLMYHFDDGAFDCLYRNNVCSLAEALDIQEVIDQIYEADFDWGEYECPIGYALHLMEQAA